jgi:hypothetical protein
VVDAGHTLTVTLTGGFDSEWNKSFNRIMRPLQREVPKKPGERFDSLEVRSR